MDIFKNFKRTVKGWFQKAQSSKPGTLSCPKCNLQMTDEGDYIYCSQCGFLIKKQWIIETAAKLNK